MTAKQYEKISAVFIKNEKRIYFFNLLNKLLTASVYIAYPMLLLYVFLFCRDKFLKSVLVPAVMLVFVSVLRKIINRPRPYEKMKINPIIKKDKSGESMPSRHIFSAFMIAMTFLYISPIFSIPLFVIAVVLAAVRVIGGVHYISDVFVAAAIGLAAGTLAYFVF